MAYDNTVPDPDNPGLEDVDAMRENFQLLEDSLVVDEGSTADGDYIRYENGWQICFKYNAIELTADNAEEEGYRSNVGRLNLPVSFVNSDFIPIAEADATLEWANARPTGVDEADAYLLAMRENRTEEINLFAIGRWK